jgi:hypothetical protein
VVALHQQVWVLRDQGWPGHSIATHLSIGKSTVFRCLRMATLPERTRRRAGGRRVLTPYKLYLRERWNGHGRDVLRLCSELQRHGYPRSYATVARNAQRLSQAQGKAPWQWPPRQLLPAVAEPQQPLLTVRRSAWLAVRCEEQRAARRGTAATSGACSISKWLRQSTSPRTMPSSCGRGNSSSSGPGARVLPRGLWEPSSALPKGSAMIMTRSKPG